MNDNIRQLRNKSRGANLVKGRLKGKIFLIPSMVTVAGIFCGFMSVLHAQLGQIELACKLIGFAFVLDGLDGRIARRLNATSAFGREFDSLSDLVAFGVAPAVLVYSWAFRGVADEFGMLIAFSLVACGATRLARFNIDTEHRQHFVGLPIPGAAAAMASLVYMLPDPITNPSIAGLIMIYTLVLAGLMVSTLSFPSVKHMRFGDIHPRYLLFLGSLAIGLAWYHARFTMLFGSLLYAFSGPMLYIVRRYSPEYLSKIKTVIR